MTTSSATALTASDQWTPTRLPAIPTVTPENARMPLKHMLIEADHAAANVRRRVQLHQRLRHGTKRQIEEAGGEQQNQR